MATYYVATTGNDNNSGTINSPWLTWQYAFNQLQPGDILYIRGGTYYPAVVSGGGYYCGVYVNNKDGTVDAQYRVEAFESEVPILDCSNITNNNYTHVGVYLNGSNYWYLKGLTVAYVPQYQAASRYGIGFQIAGGNHCTLELCVAHHNEGPGFITRTTANETHFINCDSYYNYDPYNEGGDADGWDIGFMTEDSIVRLTGCRAWENGDDGFDMYLSEEQPSPYAGIYYLTNCWAWRNGYVPGTNTAGGNGCGFKYGDDSRTSTSPIRRFSYNCIASTNRTRGFSQESAQVAKLWYNCIAHDNGQYGFSFASYNISQDILYNNISYANGGVVDALGSRTSITNSWDAGAPTITDADFKSVIYTELATIRQSNGDLPLINYLHPASGSNIIGVGTDTPELYDGDGELWNDNRSIGAFEYVGTLDVPLDVYYVDNDGHDDTGDGSYNNPWATLSHAASEVTTPGNTIHIRDGNYTISSQISISPGVSIEGTANLPTFNCTYNGVCLYLNSAEGVNGNQSISYCRFVGSYPSGTNNIGIEVVGRRNVIIHHCEFEDFFKTAISFYGKAGKVGGYPDIYPTGNKIHDCEITNCACLIYPGDQGYGNIRVGGQQDMEIYNNIIIQEDRGFNLNGFGIKFAAHGFNMGLKIYNNTIEVPPRYTGGYYNFAIELWNSRGGIEIYNNNFKGTVDIGCNDDEDYPDDDHIALNDAGGYGFALQFHHNTCGYTTLQVASESGIDLERNVTGETYIYNNYFHNLNYPIRSSMNDPGEIQEAVYIYNNIINGVGLAGTSGGRAIMIPYSSYNSHFENWNIWNNVIYAGTSGNPTQGIRFRVTTGENISIKNNIIIGFDYAVYLQGGSITNLNTDRNMVYNNDYNTIYNDGCSLTGGTQNANIVDDPEFESAGSNFHLVQDSPAIGMGTPVNIPTGNYDYDGVEYGDPPSIGAFEYTVAAVIPVITTIYVSDISTFSVKSGGNVTDDGGASVTGKGVCWSTSSNPTLSDDYTTDGTGEGSFVSNITGLSPNTTYHVRAYAINSVGTAYGSDVQFTTLDKEEDNYILIENAAYVDYSIL